MKPCSICSKPTSTPWGVCFACATAHEAGEARKLFRVAGETARANIHGAVDDALAKIGSAVRKGLR